MFTNTAVAVLPQPAAVWLVIDLETGDAPAEAVAANYRHGQPPTEAELKKQIRDEYRAKMEALDQQGRAALKKEMAKDYSRSERYIRDVTSRIDKDLKVELRETAFAMWMACHTQQEIAEAIGYAQKAVSEFLDSLQVIPNGTDSEKYNVAENPALTSEYDREFDEDDDQEDSNSLGVNQQVAGLQGAFDGFRCVGLRLGVSSVDVGGDFLKRVVWYGGRSDVVHGRTSNRSLWRSCNH